MEPYTFCAVLAIIYSLLFFFDRFFKSCMHYPYASLLKNTGFSIGFMRLRWHTTAFNRWVLRWGNTGAWTRSCITKGFTVGVLLALSLIPIGIIVLFVTIFNGESQTTGKSGVKGAVSTASALKMEIMLPGVNLPLEELGFYIATMLCSTVIHELGHAMAAVLEDIPVTGFGFQLYFFVPLAYTEVSVEHLNSLRWLRKLRILCAGIWHNFLFATLCYLLLSSMSIFAAPFYAYNRNVVVTEVSQRSPLRSGERGIQEGDIITAINTCEVSNEEAWFACLSAPISTQPGFCVSGDFIRLHDESIVIPHHSADGMLQCCDETNEKVCCYEYLQNFHDGRPAQIPEQVCLDIRRTIQDSYGFCVDAVCERGFCLRPLLRNTTTVLNIKRSSLEPKELLDVVYVGHPTDILRTVRVSPFVPKRTILSPQWGDTYALFLRYNVVFSIGLALINAIPCFGFDGYHITSTIINSFLANRIAERPKRDVISLIVTGVGTLLFAIALLKVLWLSFLRHLF